MPITREVREPKRMKMNPDLGQLSAAERLFLWRHRQPCAKGSAIGRSGGSMTQAEAARLLNVSQVTYSKLENDLRTLMSVNDIEPFLCAINHLNPTVGELCFIARRRSGNLLSTIEQEVQCSRPHYLAAERSGDRLAVSYWQGRGFRFPTINPS